MFGSLRKEKMVIANEKTDNLSRTGTDSGNTCLNSGGNFNTDVFLIKAWTEAQRGKNFVPLPL
jgi:hypothetical protein